MMKESVTTEGKRHEGESAKAVGKQAGLQEAPRQSMLRSVGGVMHPSALATDLSCPVSRWSYCFCFAVLAIHLGKCQGIWPCPSPPLLDFHVMQSLGNKVLHISLIDFEERLLSLQGMLWIVMESESLAKGALHLLRYLVPSSSPLVLIALLDRVTCTIHNEIGWRLVQLESSCTGDCAYPSAG